MLATTENNPEMKKTLENNNSVISCEHCKHAKFLNIIEGYDFDTGDKPFNVETCSHCQLARTTPLLSDDELSKFYESSYYGSSDKKFNPLIESWTVFSNNRLAKKILSGYKTSHPTSEKIRVLDIGCGRANLLKAFNRQDCECYGIERADFPPGAEPQEITIYKQDVINAPLEKESFDIVVIWHVLEHLVNPSAVLKRINEILKADGLLVIAVPNFGGIQSRIFGKHWFHLDLPRHTYHFTQSSLNQLLESNGMTSKSISTNCVDQSIFGFIQSALNSIPLGTPNTLYAILKSTQEKLNVFALLSNLVIASILLPVALTEYLLSIFSGKGACIIASVTKKR